MKSRTRSISSIAPNCEPIRISRKPSCSTRLIRWRASSGRQILAATHQPDGSHAARSEENPVAFAYILRGCAALAQPPGLESYEEAINSFCRSGTAHT
jgi:hypothetical protein